MRHIRSIFALVLVGTMATPGGPGLAAAGPSSRPAGPAAGEPAYAAFRAAALPGFDRTPNIAASVPALGPTPVVRALYGTQSGFQIYRCGRNASGQPIWSLRTPLTELAPKASTALRVRPVSNRYHFFSDFGGLVADAELGAMGLLGQGGVRLTAPVWQFTFTPPSGRGPEHSETVAGRVIAQDTVDAVDVPWLLLEVRGRAVSTIDAGVMTGTTNVADERANPIAASEYILRFNTRGGVAPAAATCNELTLGTESRRPYAADYYFVDTDPPATYQSGP